MTVAQLRSCTLPLGATAPVLVITDDGRESWITGAEVRQIYGTKTLILTTRDPDEPFPEDPQDARILPDPGADG